MRWIASSCDEEAGESEGDEHTGIDKFTERKTKAGGAGDTRLVDSCAQASKDEN
jgi:hypothetical protein